MHWIVVMLVLSVLRVNGGTMFLTCPSICVCLCVHECLPSRGNLRLACHQLHILNCFCGYYLLYYFSSALEMCGNGLQHFRALPFPSVHSHSCDASDLIPIPTPLPKFIPILSHSHSHLTNERHLSLNKSDDKFSKCKHSAV